MDKKLFFIIVSCLIVIVGGILIWQFWPVSETACTKETKACPDGSMVGRAGPNCEFAVCPTTSKNEIADWKTYRSEGYGFEIKYPSLYDFSTCKDCSDKVTIFAPLGEGKSGYVEVGIDVWETDKGSYKNVSLQNWIDEIRRRIVDDNHEYIEEGIVSVDNNYKYTEEIIEIDGMMATKIVHEAPDLLGTPRDCCGYGGPGRGVLIFVENKGLKYEISGGISGGIDKTDIQAYIPILDQILSTFTFLP